MALPDKHADEPTVEVDRDTVKLMKEAKANAKAWTDEYERLRKKFENELGDAYAATVDGEKVFTYRPRNSYAAARIIKDYPDLTQHYFEYKATNTFNLERFVAEHPEIAEQYRTRSLLEVDAL